MEVCFTNPGTSEMHFVAALDKEPGMRAILGLFEGVVTGAADGYGRMAGKPACTLLHLGPGLANGLANLHNARRARTPIVNVVGEHATYHRKLDAPLTSDIAGFASSGVRLDPRLRVRIRRCRGCGPCHPGGHAAARADRDTDPAGGHSLESGVRCSTAPEGFSTLSARCERCRDRSTLRHCSRASRARCCMNGLGVSDAGLRLASRIAQKTGARLIGDTFIARIPRGAGRVEVTRLPYFSEQAEEMLAGSSASDSRRYQGTGEFLCLSGPRQRTDARRLSGAYRWRCRAGCVEPHSRPSWKASAPEASPRTDRSFSDLHCPGAN